MSDDLGHLRAKQLVWHYTTLEALQLILQANTLLATEVAYQNDPREPETAVELINEALTALQARPEYETFARQALKWHEDWRRSNGFIRGNAGSLTANGRFIFCGSTDPDNLYAWRTYAAGSRTGCAVGLDPNVPLGRIGDIGLEPNASSSGWKRVIYESDQQLGFAISQLTSVGDAWNEEDRLDNARAEELRRRGVPDQEMLDVHNSFRVLIDEFADAVAAITAVAKHESFRDEHEVRLSFADVSSGFVFSPGRNGPRPRIALTAAEHWGQVVGASAKLPIRAIVLAPNAHREANTTTQWLLHAYGYPIDPEARVDETGPEPYMWFDPSAVISIHQSAHPYRDV